MTELKILTFSTFRLFTSAICLASNHIDFDDDDELRKELLKVQNIFNFALDEIKSKRLTEISIVQEYIIRSLRMIKIDKNTAIMILNQSIDRFNEEHTQP